MTVDNMYFEALKSAWKHRKWLISQRFQKGYVQFSREAELLQMEILGLNQVNIFFHLLLLQNLLQPPLASPFLRNPAYLYLYPSACL